jgi:hypothetical protein
VNMKFVNSKAPEAETVSREDELEIACK